jgi:hypothetical protein
LDTRQKIIGLKDARERMVQEDLLPVVVDCDPLLAVQAEALQKLGRPLLALLEDKETPYLSLQARAEMAASLKAVRYVALGYIHGAVDLRGEEREWRGQLEALVRFRNGAK